MIVDLIGYLDVGQVIGSGGDRGVVDFALRRAERARDPADVPVDPGLVLLQTGPHRAAAAETEGVAKAQPARNRSATTR